MASLRPTTISSTADDSSPPAIGVCLSGGGFRATLFGLGALRYLAEAGALGRVVAVSAVSGGSVAATVLADQWPELERAAFSVQAFEQHVAEPFVRVITRRNMRNRGLLRWGTTRLAPRRRRVGAAVGVTMARHLVRAQRVCELPAGLQVIITATDLVAGRALRISQEFTGGWDFGYGPTPPKLTVATALAASTAVPFLFPPVPLRTEALGLSDHRTPSDLWLVDGGVYDNLGLEWFQGWDRGRPAAARPVELIFAIDASGPLQRKPKRYGWLSSLKRSQEAQYAQTRAGRLRWFVDQMLSGQLRGIYVPIDRDPASFRPPPGTPRITNVADGALPDGFAAALSRLRTDLDRFAPEEASLLMYHGYWATHVRVRHLLPALAIDTPGWRDYEDLDETSSRRLLALLEEGEARRLRR